MSLLNTSAAAVLAGAAFLAAPEPASAGGFSLSIGPQYGVGYGGFNRGFPGGFNRGFYGGGFNNVGYGHYNRGINPYGYGHYGRGYGYGSGYGRYGRFSTYGGGYGHYVPRGGYYGRGYRH